MHMRSLTTISALMLGVALVATPVFAAGSTAGNQGSGQVAVNRDAPLSLPAGVTPKPVPKVDASTLSRGNLGEDPAAALASMGTVTLSRDGSVAETPASEGMRAILEQEMKGSNPSMTTDRVVDTTDDRVQITDSSGYPTAVIGWLWAQDQKGDWSTCTATLIGPKTVITAAHCVYDHDTGGWVQAMSFLPGMTDAESAPFGQFDWANINILKGFIDNYDGTNYGSVMPWDLAEIELAEAAGDQLGWLGFRVDDASDFKAEIIGYPGDKPDGTMWDVKCDIPAANFGDQIFWHNCDTYAGSSGSSMFEDAGKGDLYIRGINVAEDDKVNYGVRLIDSYYQFIIDNYK
ncbi:MAG: serine protease [Devosia nanyangense]|uniref:Serine protease n=1 Tax=Devosia nanyangense TaxID=1228055 RepID=A0A933NX94_9HYPH|nr:serine protease [Devosia nanyangense]